VWRALTEPRLLALWLMEAEGFEPRPGCRFRFRTKPAPGFDGTIHCEVLVAEAPTRLVYTWVSGRRRTRPTTVRWTLRAEGPGTRLVLDHDGFRGAGGFLLRAMLRRGWGHKLRDYVPVLVDRLASANDDEALVDPTGLLDCQRPAR
jgi:uncharacterized protein YndB with AHSA1/START domain